MSEPSLEQIAAGSTPTGCDINNVVIARELLAQRKFLEAFTGKRPPEEVFAFFRSLHEIELRPGVGPELDAGVTREMLNHDLSLALRRSEHAERELAVLRGAIAGVVSKVERLTQTPPNGYIGKTWMLETLQKALDAAKDAS